MKKVSLLGLFLLASTTQFAAADVVVAEGPVAVAPVGGGAVPAPGCPKEFQGFYLGGNVGYGVGWAKFKHNNAANSEVMSHLRGIRGFDGGLNVGYLHRLCNWALGLEFDADWAGTKGNHTHARAGVDRFLHKVRLKNSLALLGRLGYVMRGMAMPFIGLGWSNAQYKQTATFTDLAADTTEIGHKSKRINAFLWRMGVDFLATKHVVVGFEYTGTYGGKSTLRSSDRNFTSSVKPQYNKFALTARIVY